MIKVLGRLGMIGRSVPNLVVSKRVIERMVAAASQYIEDETGEAMVGLLVPGDNTNGVPTLYVLDTIAPDESATVRHVHTFQQGDERQDEIIWWLQENWHTYREKRRGSFGKALQGKWDVPLRYLGDWHKQPGYMIHPSGGDRMTALDWLDDESNEMAFLLAPIVTLGHPSTTTSPDGMTNFQLVSDTDGTLMRIDWWYIDQHTRMFTPINPALYPEDQLPGLTPYPWHLVDVERFEEESALLADDGLFSTLVLWDADDALPLEICFMMARVGSDKVLIVITSHNFPEKPPSARVAPFIAMDEGDQLFEVFEQLWQDSKPVNDPPGWAWSPDMRLLDYVLALEESLGIERTTPPAAETEPEADEPDADEPTNDEEPPIAEATEEDTE